MSAINMTNNTMLWQYPGMANGLGDCYSGSLATGGNLVFTWFKGRSDLNANGLLNNDLFKKAVQAAAKAKQDRKADMAKTPIGPTPDQAARAAFLRVLNQEDKGKPAP